MFGAIFQITRRKKDDGFWSQDWAVLVASVGENADAIRTTLMPGEGSNISILGRRLDPSMLRSGIKRHQSCQDFEGVTG